MVRYRAAIVGCGRIASLFSNDPLRKGIITHADAYLKHPQTKLIAACDVDKERLCEFGERWGIGRLYDNLDEMLHAEKIDILSICTPPASHCPILGKAVEFPIKAVFCEKPLAESASQGSKMAKLCARNKIILQVGHQRRFDPLHQALKKIILGRKMGRVQQVNFFYTAGIKNTGSHMFDLLRFILGDASWIEGFYSKSPSRRDKDPNIDGIIKFKDGTIVTFQALDVDKYMIFELSLFLEAGKIVLKNSGFNVDMYRVARSKFYSGYKELSGIRSNLKENYRRDFLYFAVDHLVKCIKNKKESISNGLDGLRALELVHGAISSARSGGRRINV